MIERKEILPMFQLVDMLDNIKKERKKLQLLVNSEQFEKNYSWCWMTEWLEKTDDEHLIEGLEIYEESDSEKDLGNYVCHFCFTPNRYLLTTLLPLDNGYKRTIHLCSKCRTKIGELAKQLILLERD